MTSTVVFMAGLRFVALIVTGVGFTVVFVTGLEFTVVFVAGVGLAEEGSSIQDARSLRHCHWHGAQS